MKKVKIIGYYKDLINREEDQEEVNEKLLYFVVYGNSTIDGSKQWLEGYNIMDGHFEIKDKEYLSLCEKITKEEYIDATKGWYTPIEYL